MLLTIQWLERHDRLIVHDLAQYSHMLYRFLNIAHDQMRFTSNHYALTVWTDCKCTEFG